MGIISRKIFPACGNMCVCCPALRSRSRQPVKRYKKLLAEVFPKSADSPSNDRKIVKLCEYASKNPFRIPKITMYLEERCYKELRSQHVKFVEIIVEVYYKLLTICRDQMACFAAGLLNVVVKLLDESQDALKIIGCQMLTHFIYSQVDGTYSYNLESLVGKICKIAEDSGEEHKKRCLRSSSLQSLSAMVWFMGEFSHIFDDFEKIVHATVKNYEADRHSEHGGEQEVHHNWVNEVVRCEGRGLGEFSPVRVYTRPRPERKDPSQLTREELESPKVWAQICVQRMVELAKESSTMRRVLDPMFFYFDQGSHWASPRGLALVVLSDMCYFMDNSGSQLLVLASVVRHLDHKNIVHDPQVKSSVIQTATYLARQIRNGAVLSGIGFVSDLCRHLRKSLQATFESVGEQEPDTNTALQASLEDLLLEIAKGINDTQPLFDIMAMSLEEISSVKVAAKATIGSLIVLAHMISLAAVSSQSEQVFPETLLVQLLKLMFHADVEVRLGGHHIFSVLLIPSLSHTRPEVSNYTKRWRSNSTSTFDSVAALLEKLRREKGNAELKNGSGNQESNTEDEAHLGWAPKNSPSLNKISSIIDKAIGSASLTEAELSVHKFDEDQTAQVLTAFWMQATLSDNLPTNLEAIAHSFCLTLISSRFKNTQGNLIVRFFHVPLSLLKMSMDPNNGSFSPAYQRSLFVLSTALLMFTARIYHIHDLVNLLKSSLELDVDPCIGISDDYQVYVKPQTDIRGYGSLAGNDDAAVLISKLHSKMEEYEKIVIDLLVRSLTNITQIKADDIADELSEGFIPDDALMFGPQSILDFNNSQMVSCSKESPSFDGEFSSTNLFVDDDVTSESSVADLSRAIPGMFMSPCHSMSHVVSIGQLMESALEVAGQVAGTSISTSPLPYSAMANQCESLGTDTRNKLSNWLTHEKNPSKAVTVPPTNPLRKMITEERLACGSDVPRESWMALRLPPASPFDNFLKAARG